ncbi:MAG: phosphotransferase, partial [Stellaceae bacterium]
MSEAENFGGTMPVVERLRFDVGALEPWMDAHIPGFRGPLEVEQFRGGQSNPTYRLKGPSGRYVLRRKPPGKLLPSAHAVDREYRVMTALGSVGFPVPRTHGLCLYEAVIGTAFFLMEYVEGRVFWDPELPELGLDERAHVYDAMNAVIARLHTID